MRTLTALALATLTFGTAACTSGPDSRLNNTDTGTGAGVLLGGLVGSQFGGGSGRIVGTVIGAVAGGVIGNGIGRRLDDRDRDIARQAEYDALERGRSGEPYRWRSRDDSRYGEVIPQSPYQRAGRDCRDYIHTVYIDGRPETMRASACRNPDGTWVAAG